MSRLALQEVGRASIAPTVRRAEVVVKPEELGKDMKIELIGQRRRSLRGIKDLARQIRVSKMEVDQLMHKLILSRDGPGCQIGTKRKGNKKKK